MNLNTTPSIATRTSFMGMIWEAVWEVCNRERIPIISYTGLCAYDSRLLVHYMRLRDQGLIAPELVAQIDAKIRLYFEQLKEPSAPTTA